MTDLSFVNLRPPTTVRFRPMKLAGLALALAGALVLAACGRQDGGLKGGDVDLALKTLTAAPEQGFAADQFHTQRIEQLLHSASPGDKRTGATELRAALIDYARAQHGLSIPKSAFPHDWGLTPASYDAEAALDQALREGKFKDWLEGQPTPLPAYPVLQKAYVQYLKIAAAGGWPTVTGAQDPQLLLQRLALEDPELAGADEGATVDLGAALQRFQAAHGLVASGSLDAETLRELNVPAITRAAQIRANLERLRWLPREQPATRVDVNTAAATMAYYKDGALVTQMLAASGKPGDETPMLASRIDGIMLNPAWHVPDQIAEKEILPKGEAYLQEKGFAMKDGQLVQQAGPDAALGLVKFEFDNPYAVYLHDTPSKAAFTRTSRAVSHGCVRLAQAVDFAKLLLSQEQGWSPERVDQTLASGETLHVKLAHTTPVRLIYLTAVAENGRVSFRPDIYGWDRTLLQLLDNPPAPRKAGKRT